MASNGTGLLVVGGGLASARAVKAYREAGGEGAVTLISADDFLPYHRPPLSKKFLRGESEAEDALVESEAFYREHDIDVVLGTRATAFRADERVVVATDGEHRFEKLLIATGASPSRLDVPGADRDEVFTLRTIDNSKAIRDAAREARHAVVVGAGFIGMEVAASLSHLDVEVTLVHRGKGLFETLRARQLAQYLTELYGTKGVNLVLGDEVAEFAGRESLDSVRTKRGEVYQAELAVVGVGVRPNTDWLDGGLRIDDGVVVNERYETGLPNVWAVGDVARFYDPLFERYRRIEHWSNANHQGTDVGRLIAGGDGGGYDVVSTFFSEVFGVTFKVFGDIDEFDEIVIRGSLDDGDAIAFYLGGDRLVACLLTGQDDDTEAKLKELIAARATVSDLEALVRGDDLESVFAR